MLYFLRQSFDDGNMVKAPVIFEAFRQIGLFSSRPRSRTREDFTPFFPEMHFTKIKTGSKIDKFNNGLFIKDYLSGPSRALPAPAVRTY